MPGSKLNVGESNRRKRGDRILNKRLDTTEAEIFVLLVTTEKKCSIGIRAMYTKCDKSKFLGSQRVKRWMPQSKDSGMDPFKTHWTST